MKQVLPNIWQWSWFSEEKQLEFNGLLLNVGEHRILVDPPPLTSEDLIFCRRGGAIDYIIVTNRDHQREAAVYQKELGCRLYVPAADASAMHAQPDKTYTDGELLPGGIWVIHLRDQKSPGESGLFIQQGRGVLIVGDALIGKPAGSLSMLASEKYENLGKARDGLQRLLNYQFDTVLVGDGACIMAGGKRAVEQALQP